LSAGGTDGGDAGGEFVEIGFSDDDGTGFAEFADLEGVGGGSEACERQGTGSGGDVGGAVVVFEDDGDAVERAAGAFGGAFAVESFGVVEGVGVEGDECVETGAFLVEGLYAV
jgi:hypothetical protein